MAIRKEFSCNRPLATLWPWMSEYQRKEMVNSISSHQGWFMAVVNKIHAELIAGTRRVEDGTAPVSFEVRPLARLIAYYHSGFPYMARVDTCDAISTLASQVLGVIPSMRVDSYGGDPCSDLSRGVLHYDSNINNGRCELSTGYVTAICRDMIRADIQRYKGKTPPTKYSPASMVASYPSLAGTIWWEAAAARWAAGQRYVVTWSDPATTYTKIKRVRYERYYEKKRICTADLALDNKLFSWSTAGWWNKRGANTAHITPDWAAPCMPEDFRKQAYTKHGHRAEARFEIEDDLLTDWYRAHRSEVTKDLKKAQHVPLRLLAFKACGYSPADRTDGNRSIIMHAVIKFGFTPEMLAAPYKMTTELQRLYIRYYGLACEDHTKSGLHDYLVGAVQRVLRRGQVAHCRETDLLALGQGHDFFNDLLKDTRPNAAEELAGFFLVALDTIAAHPEIAMEYQVYLQAFFSRNQLDYPLKLINFAIQNAKGIEAARESRFGAQGLHGVAQKADTTLISGGDDDDY